MPTAHNQKWKVTVDGAKELGKQLEGMGDEAASLIDDAVNAGADIIQAKGKQYAGNRIKNATGESTGNLVRNIVKLPVTRRAGHAGRKRRIVAGSVKVGFNRSKKGAGDDAYYGSFFELGTKYQDAKYPLRDALDWNKNSIAQAVIAKFKKLMGR